MHTHLHAHAHTHARPRPRLRTHAKHSTTCSDDGCVSNPSIVLPAPPARAGRCSQPTLTIHSHSPHSLGMGHLLGLTGLTGLTGATAAGRGSLALLNDVIVPVARATDTMKMQDAFCTAKAKRVTTVWPFTLALRCKCSCTLFRGRLLVLLPAACKRHAPESTCTQLSECEAQKAPAPWTPLILQPLPSACA